MTEKYAGLSQLFKSNSRLLLQYTIITMDIFDLSLVQAFMLTIVNNSFGDRFCFALSISL